MKFNEAVGINEEIKSLNGKKGIIVFDIDDTLLTADSSTIKIYKTVHGGPEVGLNTSQFASDPDKGKPGVKYDYREFRDPEKVYSSIVNGTPILNNLKIMDAHIRANYDFCFLTARGLQDVVDKALRKFLLTKDKNGKLVGLGDAFKDGLSSAINDDFKVYPGASDSEKKANVLRKLCNEYDVVRFVDDDARNIQAARELGLPNLKVIQAHKAGENNGKR